MNQMINILLLLFFSGCITHPTLTHKIRPQTKVPLSDKGLPVFKKDNLKIMVIEYGLIQNVAFNQEISVRKTNNSLYNSHGTRVLSTVLFGDLQPYKDNTGDIQMKDLPRLCKQVEVTFCQAQDPHGTSYYPKECLEKAINEQYDIINYSSSGGEYSVEEFLLWQKFSDQGGVSYVSAGNDSTKLDNNVFPASWGVSINGVKYITNMYTVQNLDNQGKIYRSSNYHPEAISELGTDILTFSDKSYMTYSTGTSFASPMVVHKVAEQYCSQFKK